MSIRAFRHINVPYGQMLVLPNRRLVRPAADDDFVNRASQVVFALRQHFYVLQFWQDLS